MGHGNAKERTEMKVKQYNGPSLAGKAKNYPHKCTSYFCVVSAFKYIISLWKILQNRARWSKA